MSWIEEVQESIPDHATDIKVNLDIALNQSILDEVDAHAIAFVSAIASSNGGLAQEIEMNGLLFGNRAERTAAKTAAALMGMNNTWLTFIEMSDDAQLKNMPSGLTTDSFATYGGVSKKKFAMYALAASIVGKCQTSTKCQTAILKDEGATLQELQAIGRIAAVINAVGKVAI